MRAQAASEKPLDSTPLANQSDALRRKSVFLVALNLLFTAALFLFTAVLRTDIGRKLGWMTAGILFYACGIGLALGQVLF
jgi:hypothetical protein